MLSLFVIAVVVVVVVVAVVAERTHTGQLPKHETVIAYKFS